MSTHARRSLVFAAALSLLLQQASLCQPTPAMPAWLSDYPGVTGDTKSFPALIQSTYTAPAVPSAVRDHYRKLFEAENLPFVPGSDGIGTVIRGAAAECDLMITIRQQGAGSTVQVSCAAKSVSFPTAANSRITVTETRASMPRPAPIRPGTGSPRREMPSAEQLAESHRKAVAEMGIHREYKDADAPPLVWPAWLVPMNGARPKIQAGVDQSKKDYLKASFVSSAPMRTIHDYYEELLNAHDYPVYSGRVSTGQTISGKTQDAWGNVEGSNYPNGSPGPRTVINVSFSRSRLNDPITVEMRITTYSFQALKRPAF